MVCPVGQQKKTDANVVCGANKAECDTKDKLCCGTATCKDYLCDSNLGWAAKIDNQAIVCGASSDECTVDLCCQAKCSNPAVTCAAGTKKPDVVCTGGVATCDAGTCCSAVTCKGFTCPAGFADAANKDFVECGATAGGCSTDKCCTWVCSNSLVTCAAPLSKLDSAPTVVCGTKDKCTADVCCGNPTDGSCKDFQCPTASGLANKKNKDLIVCGNNKLDCTVAMCCDVTCSNSEVVCLGSKKSSPEAIVCGEAVDKCTEQTCCADGMLLSFVVFIFTSFFFFYTVGCNSFTCPAGNVAKAGAATVKCSNGVCTEATCCDTTCENAGVTCPALKKKKSETGIVCGSDPAACNADDTKCCGTATCKDYLCDSNLGWAAKLDQQAIICGASSDECTVDLCCQAKCSNPAVTCAAGTKKPDVVCTGGVATCDAGTCCSAVTCKGFTCPAGFADAANKDFVECGATAGGCSTDKCCTWVCSNSLVTCAAPLAKLDSAPTVVCGTKDKCTADVCCGNPTAGSCKDFQCPTASGLASKANQDLIVCGSTKLDCTVAMCCDVTCSNSEVVCLGSKKSSPEAIVCGEAVDKCTEQMCCSSVTCKGFTCSAGFMDKDNKAAIACDSNQCNAAKCCTATCSNDDFTCPTGSFKKGGAEKMSCGATAGDCSGSLCCGSVTCVTGMYQCPPGFVRKIDSNLIGCGTAASDCNSEVCCDVTCSNDGFACPAGAKKTPAEKITCGDKLAACDETKCCGSVSCASFPCGNGWADKANKETITCGPSLSSCMATTCCTLTCDAPSFSCTVGSKKAAAATLVCDAGPCTDATCCGTVVCSSFTCGTGMVPKPGSASLVCGGTGDCTVAMCCDATCALATCQAGTKKNVNQPCGGTAAECTEEMCCTEVTCASFTCGDGYGKKATVASCGPTRESCNLVKCCDVSCSNTGFTCPAPKGKLGGVPALCGAAVADCTADKCCGAATCEAFTCPSPAEKKSDASKLYCKDADSCTTDICCDLPAGTTFAPPPTTPAPGGDGGLSFFAPCDVGGRSFPATPMAAVSGTVTASYQIGTMGSDEASAKAAKDSYIKITATFFPSDALIASGKDWWASLGLRRTEQTGTSSSMAGLELFALDSAKLTPYSSRRMTKSEAPSLFVDPTLTSVWRKYGASKIGTTVKVEVYRKLTVADQNVYDFGKGGQAFSVAYAMGAGEVLTKWEKHAATDRGYDAAFKELIFKRCDRDPLAAATGSDDSSDGLAWWVIMLIILGALLICCFIVAVLMKKRRDDDQLEYGEFVKIMNDQNFNLDAELDQTHLGGTEAGMTYSSQPMSTMYGQNMQC